MPKADQQLQIAVAGGSIGGLCAGLALHGSGFDVQVYERHAGPMEARGAGIVVQSELLQLLRNNGAAALPTTSCIIRRYLHPDGGDGQPQAMPRTSPPGRRSTERCAPPSRRSATTWAPRSRALRSAAAAQYPPRLVDMAGSMRMYLSAPTVPSRPPGDAFCRK